MDYSFTVEGSDGSRDVYEHVMQIHRVNQFKYGMEICIVQNEDSMDIWVLALHEGSYEAAYSSIKRYYYDSYGWDYDKMNSITFTVEL